MSTAIRTRIAPSPTGEYHIGHIRTLLYNYALAKKHHGQFILRIENTDQKRLVAGAQEKIMQVIKDYGFSWDEGPDIGGPFEPYVQTKRLDHYQKYINQLLDQNQAYYCFCTEERLTQLRDRQRQSKQIPKYDRHCLALTSEEVKANLNSKTPYVIRLKVPDNQIIEFDDVVRGKIKINTNEIDDQVLIKSNGIPTYHFAVVVDDHLMKISHVLRGDEWISSTPKQVLLYRYFDWPTPKFVHLPVILDPNGPGKMSKRHGSVSARSFLEGGFLPEALNNFLMLLGWNPGTDQEFFSLDDFIKAFSLDRLHKKQPRFDIKKLTDFNIHYIQALTDQDLCDRLKSFLPDLKPDIILALVPLIKPRIHTLKDAKSLCQYFWTDPDYDQDLLLQRGLTKDLAKDILSQTKTILDSVSDWTFDTIQNHLLDLIKKNNWNTGQFFMVFRVAIAGSPITPPIVETLPILGKDKTLAKITKALSLLN